MPSILLVVFILQLSLHLINTIGAQTLNELLWVLYNKLPTPTSSSAQKSASLKREVVRLKRELGKVSAQDQFSTWAKLQRQHDKALSEFQKIDGSLRTHKATFDRVVSTLRWLGTQGARFVIQFWFAKSPMFWLPADWVPYYVEWILSFPRAPLGSISINVWGIACASMIALVGEAITAGYVLVMKKPLTTEGDPMAFEAKPKTGEKTEGQSKASPAEKKEL